MPNIKSAIKRDKTAKRRAESNRDAKSKVATLSRRFAEAVAEGDKAKAEAAYKVYCSTVDKGVKKGVVAKNAASRRKSNATRKLAAMK